MLASVVLAGCSKGPASTGTTGQTKKVKIQLACFGANWEDKLYTDSYIPEFEDKNPNIEVEFIHLDDFVARYTTMAAGGQLPDVMRQVTGLMPIFMSKGTNAPLDEYIEKDKFDLSDFAAGALKPCTRDNKIYAIPQDTNVAGLFYNPEMFKAAGLDEPDDNYTLEQMMADAKVLTKEIGGKVERYGVVVAYNGWNFLPFLLAQGGNLWTEDRQKCALGEESAISALEYWRELMDVGCAPYPADMGSTGAEVYFQTGKAAMLIDGTWMAPTLTQNAPDLKFKVTSFPKGVIKTSRSQSAVFGIAENSNNKDAAWELIKFLTSKEALTEYWQKSWVAPGARLSAMNSPEFKEIPGQPEFEIPAVQSEQEFNDKLKWIITSYNNKWDNQSWIGPHQQFWEEITNNAISSALIKDGGVSPKDALTQAADDINQLIEQNK